MKELKHIGIIMDGNGRWAKEKMLPKKAGHKKGAETLKKIAKKCNELNIQSLTAYAFSTENWNRSYEEVDYLMKLLEHYLDDFIKDAEDDIIIKAIGDIEKLSETLQNKIKIVEQKTKDNKGLCMNIAINYGGRDEIVRSTKKIVNDVLNKKINENNIDENLFSSYLDTNVEIDLLIRTSGEIRISNFLLWQLAYSEMYFVNKYWPSFNVKDLESAIEEYNKRNRRFGSRNEE